MGAGAFAAGIGPAGFDPPLTPSRFAPVLPIATYYDPEARAFPLVAGVLAALHPVDQAVALRLGIALGTVTAMPNLGLDQRRLRRTLPEQMQDTVNDEVRLRLSDLIANEDITLLGSPLMPDAEGRPFFFVDYVNRRLPQGTPTTRVPVGI